MRNMKIEEVQNMEIYDSNRSKLGSLDMKMKSNIWRDFFPRLYGRQTNNQSVFQLGLYNTIGFIISIPWLV